MIIESQQQTDLGTRLPHFLTDMVGREREIVAIVDLLSSDETRLLTITGTGGVGKTRVAIEAGTRVQRHHGSTVAWVALAGLDDHLDMEQTVASALGLHDRPGVTPAESLREAIADDKVCLILDNFEQIIDAAPRIVDLLHACPRLKIFVTSRERLRVRGEREFPLEPLTIPAVAVGHELPGFDTIADSPAVSLLIDRARDILPEFRITEKNASALASICTSLDGLPLALELVAAQLRYMPVNALADRVAQGVRLLESNARDLPKRQQTLASTIDWSYQLLTPQEQIVFRYLSVFRGGFSIEAAEGVLSGLPESDTSIYVLDCLTSLVEKNLVRQLLDHDGALPPRFLLLSTIRDFSAFHLRENNEEPTARTSHANWYASELASQWELPNIGWIPGSVLDNVETNHQNLRRAMDWFDESGNVAAGLQLAGSLVPFWLERGHRNEGLETLIQLFRKPGSDDAPAIVRAAATYGASMLSRSHGPLDTAESFARQSLELYAANDHHLGIGAAELALGIILRTIGKLDQAQEHLELAVAEFEHQSEPLWRYVSWRDLGMLHVWKAQHELAEPLLNRALEGFRDADNTWGVAVTLMAIARSLMGQRRWSEAANELSLCLDTAVQLGTPEILTDVLADTGILGGSGIDRVASLRMLAAIERECHRLDYRFEQPEWDVLQSSIQSIRAACTKLELQAVAETEIPVGQEQLIELARQILATVTNASPSTLNASAFPDLTSRELEVLVLVAKGMSDREIGDQLSISHRTVMRHVANMLPKLGVTSRTIAAALWHQQMTHPPTT